MKIIIGYFNLFFKKVLTNKYLKIKGHNPYNLGFTNNLIELWGEKKLNWFFPTNSNRGDGYSYRIKEDV